MPPTRLAPRSPAAWPRAPAQSRRGAPSYPGAERASAPARVPHRAGPPAVSATRAAPAARPSRGRRGASWRRQSAASAGLLACRRGRGGRRGTAHAPARGCSRAAAVGWHAGCTAATTAPLSSLPSGCCRRRRRARHARARRHAHRDPARRRPQR
eukprot:scaffold65652_cov71-Phaeocystis_antarctica.AAC.5